MRIFDQAGSSAPRDKVCAERLRTRILHGLLGCAALWILAALLFANGAFWPAFLAILLPVAPWAWGLLAWVDLLPASRVSGLSASSSDQSAGLFLAVFAIPAVAPTLSTIVFFSAELTFSLPEMLPDRAHARKELVKLMGDLQTESLSRIYHTQRNSDSLPVNLFQVTVSHSEAGRDFLRSRGFAPGEAELKSGEIAYQPRSFPVTWMPFSLSSNLEVWRAENAIAWLDAERSVVYLVVYPGWRAPHKPPL